MGGRVHMSMNERVKGGKKRLRKLEIETNGRVGGKGEK